jgi:hypothetical protein
MVMKCEVIKDQTKEEVAHIALVLMEHGVYFYLANKVIGKFSFTLHGDNIRKAEELFPELVETVPHRGGHNAFGVGFIRGKLL